MPVELRKFHKTCSKGKTPLVIFHDDPHLPTNQIRALARKLHVRNKTLLTTLTYVFWKIELTITCEKLGEFLGLI